VTSSANGFAAKMSRGSFFWRNFITVLNIALKRHCSLIGGAGRFTKTFRSSWMSRSGRP